MITTGRRLLFDKLANSLISIQLFFQFILNDWHIPDIKQIIFYLKTYCSGFECWCWCFDRM